MSVSLKEVIEAGGYDLSTLSDARWLLSKVAEWDELIDEANDIIDAEEQRIADEDEAEYLKTFPKEERDDA